MHLCSARAYIHTLPHLCSTHFIHPHFPVPRYDVRYAGVVAASLARLGHPEAGPVIDLVLEHAVRRAGEAYTREMAVVCKVRVERWVRRYERCGVWMSVLEHAARWVGRPSRGKWQSCGRSDKRGVEHGGVERGGGIDLRECDFMLCFHTSRVQHPGPRSARSHFHTCMVVGGLQ